MTTTVVIGDGMAMIVLSLPEAAMMFDKTDDEGIEAMIAGRIAALIEENTAGMTGTMTATTAVKVANMIGMTTAMIGEVIGMVTMMIGGVTDTMIAMTVMMIADPMPVVRAGGWIEPIMWPETMAGRDGKLPVLRRWIGRTGRNV